MSSAALLSLNSMTSDDRAVWQPGEVSKTNLGRFMAHVGVPDFATLREALRRDSQLFARILARAACRLPYSLVLVFDQIEEVFTLAKTPEEVAHRDHALRRPESRLPTPEHRLSFPAWHPGTGLQQVSAVGPRAPRKLPLSS